MRGILTAAAACFAFLSLCCSNPPAPANRATRDTVDLLPRGSDDAPVQFERGPHLVQNRDEPRPQAEDNIKGARDVTRTNDKPSYTAPPAPVSPTFDDWVYQQKDRVLRDPKNLDEVRRLVVMLAASGNELEAERWLSHIPESKRDPLLKLVDVYLQEQLGQRLEAKEKLLHELDSMSEKEGIRIVTAKLVREYRGYRMYEPVESNVVAPGSYILLYVEYENFRLTQTGEYRSMYVKYDWELYNDDGKKLNLPMWEKAPIEAKTDKLDFRGVVRGYSQSFKLPLPSNLEGGHYTVRITVEDQLSGERKNRDVANVPIEVSFK